MQERRYRVKVTVHLEPIEDLVPPEDDYVWFNERKLMHKTGPITLMKARRMYNTLDKTTKEAKELAQC